MRYLSHTPEDVAAMLAAIGIKSIEELFQSIPASLRMKKRLKLPEPLTEWGLEERISAMEKTMGSPNHMKIFLGAGSYHHHIPEIVRFLLCRSEFQTSYTPYQPEISQGTLQAIFEYQTYVSRLLGMDMANASMYDGATALAEGALMAIRVTRKEKLLISPYIHPHYRQVIETYLKPTACEIINLPTLSNGRTGIPDGLDYKEIAALVIQSPNFMGIVEDMKRFREESMGKSAFLICGFSEPLAYGLYKSPGFYGVDLACGEGQSFGVPQSFGGPGLGMFAFKKEYVRNTPGRLVGETKDLDGKRGYVLTLATREQHIRREKATSNICTNQGLCALAAAIYMASLGRTGLRDLSRMNYDKACYLREGLRKKGVKIPFNGPIFNEFVAQLNDGCYERLMEKGILAGLPLKPFYPELSDHYLLCVTETIKKDDMDKLIQEV